MYNKFVSRTITFAYIERFVVKYNLAFTTFATFLSQNKLTEAEAVELLQAHCKNQNYRSQYNAKKSALLKSPEVKALLRKLGK